MAVQAQFGGLVLPSPYTAEEQMRAIKDYGALLSAVAVPTTGADAYACQQYDYCAAQSELTCNGAGGGAALPVPSRKRVRDDELLLLRQYYNAPPLLPLPGTRSPDADPAAASTSGRPLAEISAATEEEHALASELWRHGAAEVDALVRAECDRLRAGLEAAVARKRQRQALLVRTAAVAVSGLARRARDAEARLEAARRRAAELEERVRRAEAEAQAWCGVARGNEAVAAGLRATLDAVLVRSSCAAAAGEGFGESEPDDAQSSCCYDVVMEATDTAAAATVSTSSSASPAAKRACRACGGAEASVLVLPCRHLCLCKACEPRMDACPVCSGAKNASLHIALD